MNFTNNKILISIILITLCIPIIFLSTTSSMISTWYNDGTFTHGFLIFPISIWLIYQKKDLFHLYDVKPEPKIFILFFISIFTWFLAKVVDVQVVQQFVLISLIPFTIWIIFGRKIISLIIFPMVYLFFAVPMGKSLTSPMMDFTADFTVMMLKLVSIPVYRDGLFFSLPTGNWSVIEACSGVRYLIATLSLGTIYAYLTYTSFTKRFIFIIIAIIVSVLANGLRAFGIVIIGHSTNMQYGTGGDHTFYGWLFYGVVIFLLFYLGMYWADNLRPNLIKKNNDHKEISNFNSSSRYSLVLLVFMLLIQMLPNTLTTAIGNIKLTKPTLSLPENFVGWQQTKDLSTGWKPSILNPKFNLESTYLFGNEIIQLNVGYYLTQQQGSEAVSSENNLVGPEGKGWQKLSGTDLNINNSYITETVLRNRTQKILVWQWYMIGKMETPNQIIAKILNAINLIIYRRNDASFITIATPITKSKEHSRAQLISFHEDAHDRIFTSISQLIYDE